MLRRDARASIEGPPLPRLSVLAAFMAAIMLVIGGTPVRAATGPCDPCPPDCPMMAQASADQAHQPPIKTPRGDAAQSPCQAMVVCPAAIALLTPAQTLAVAWLTPEDAGLRPANEQRTPSWPPDRDLRPPIQL